MKKLLVVVLVSGCWTSSKPASEPTSPAPVAASSTGGATYGGATYGDPDPRFVARVVGVTTPLTNEIDPQDIEGGFAAEGGLGTTGVGTGGGGTGWGTIGTGRYGTIGNGSGTGTGYGTGRGGMRGRNSSVPTVRIGQPAVTGDLDKAIIRRYLKRNIQKLTYCYEKELLATPGIQGTVTATFTIALDTGKVTSSNATGVDPNVASCVASVIAAIEFPRPKGTADVDVSYPLTFVPAT